MIAWHIFEFTLISNMELLLQKIWTSKEQRISLAIVYPSFIFCEFQLVYCADSHKWRPIRDGKILWKIVDRSMWFDVSFNLFLNCWHFWVVFFFLLALLSLRLCFDSLCLTEVMAEEVLSKLRGTCKVYLRDVENSSKEVNDVLETFLRDGNFDIIIRLNTLKTSIPNKVIKSIK